MKGMLPIGRCCDRGGSRGVREMGRLKLRLECDEWIYEEYDLG